MGPAVDSVGPVSKENESHYVPVGADVVAGVRGTGKSQGETFVLFGSGGCKTGNDVILRTSRPIHVNHVNATGDGNLP